MSNCSDRARYHGITQTITGPLTRLLCGASAMALLTCLSNAAAHASPITYTFTGTGSGALGGTNFTNQSFSLTFVGDTTNVANPSSSLYQLTTFSSTAFLIGATSATLTGGAQLFDDQNYQGRGSGESGIASAVGSILFSSNSSVYTTYDLRSSLGPTVPAPVDFIQVTVSIATSAGNLSFSSVNNEVFTARLGGSASAPEPGSLVLLALAAGMPIVGTIRHRARPSGRG